MDRRLRVVRRLIRAELQRRPRGPVRVLSLCAGDGRDLLGVLATWRHRGEVAGRLVDSDAALVARGTRALAAMRLPTLEFVRADAGETTALVGAAPADLLLACGIFGNVSNADIRRTIRRLPELCAADGLVVWTRGRFAPDLTPSIRFWFAEGGFEEVAFEPIRGTTMAVGAHRLRGPPRPARRGVRLFRFLPPDSRPSARSRAAPASE